MGNPSVTYRITESGLKLLDLINNLQEMLEPSDKHAN